MNGKSIQSREVFLSSTTSDLAHYRTVAHQVIDALNDEFNGQYSLTGLSMTSETQSGERETAVDVSRRWVAEADWIVLIVAWNYGFVPDGEPGRLRADWEPCSVTEWEFRQATQVSDPPKKCFVFMAGERSDGAEFEYRALDMTKEPVNLMGFLAADRADKLAAFRKTLRGGRFELFRNVEHFQQRLTQTLRRKIQKDLKPPGPDPAPEPGTGIEWLLLFTGLLTPVGSCIASVKTLATLKRLHDRLHRIRQFGIRRWREVVLMRWQGEGEVPAEARAIYFEGLGDVKDLIGEIRGLFGSLAGDMQTSLGSLPRVVDHFSINGSQMPEKRELFEQSTDRFASRVQAAFTACDWQMRLVAAQLASRHQLLVGKGRVAQFSQKLTTPERHLLGDEIDQTVSLHDRLQAVLRQHNDWQRVHDDLQVVDDHRHLESFETAIAPVIDAAQETSRLAESAAALVEGDARRASLNVLIDKVRRNLNSLVAHVDESAYDAMRKAFDDLFFEVDRETLKSVEESEDRSTLLEQSLRGKQAEFDEWQRKADERRLGGG